MVDSGLMMGVITGDLHRSSSDYERGLPYIKIMEVMLKNLIKNKYFRVNDVDFFRGDSFQVTSSDPIHLLSAAVYIRAYLRSYSDDFDSNGKYDARLSISIDKYNKYRRDTNSIFELAQIKSGRGFDLMNGSDMMSFNSSIESLNEIYSPPIILLDALISQMSKSQSEILREIIYCRDLNVYSVAEKLGKTKQVIYKTMKRGAVDKVIKFLDVSYSFSSLRLF